MNIKLFSSQFLLSIAFALSAAAQPEIEMVFVEGGKFMMGSNEGEEFNRPAHEVSVQSFKIGKYEVTQLQWRLVMGFNCCSKLGLAIKSKSHSEKSLNSTSLKL